MPSELLTILLLLLLSISGKPILVQYKPKYRITNTKKEQPDKSEGIEDGSDPDSFNQTTP